MRYFYWMVMLIVFFSGPSLAQTGASPGVSPGASPASIQFAGLIAKSCLPGWETQTCMKAISESSYVMVSTYGGDLEGRKMMTDAEALKQHCAATTAAREQNVPAYAMNSALTECANTITDIAGRTGIAPDPSHFQLMVIPVLCLTKNPACAQITEQLKGYAR